jgi:leucyl-tRNA synthetase
MLAPMTPHIAEEMWERLGHADGLGRVAWPAASRDLAQEDEVEIPVQINGKLRGKVKVAAGTGEEEVVKRATTESAIASHLNSKRIVKIIFVPDKLLNLVIA